MSDETPIATFAGTSAEAAQIMEICNLWRAAFATAEGAQLGASTVDCAPERMSLAITAAAIMAGTFVGNAIVAGLMSEQDKRRATEVFARNFRGGIDIGKRQALRAVAEMPVAGRA